MPSANSRKRSPPDDEVLNDPDDGVVVTVDGVGGRELEPLLELLPG